MHRFAFLIGALVAPLAARADEPLTDAQLVELAMLSEETIVVDDDSAAPVDTPSAGVRVIDAETIANTPKKNADDLLRLVPGLYTSQHGSEGKAQQFFLRGFDAVHGADLAIRVGGILLNEQSNVHGQGYADLGFVVPETVGSMVSRKGPFDLEQGWFATAGSLELTLAVPVRGRRVGYELGSTNRHRFLALEAPSDGPDAEFIAVEGMHDDGYGANRGAQRGSVTAQTEITAGRVKLRPLVVGYWSKFGEPGVIAQDDIDAGTFDRMAAPAGDLGGTSRRVIVGLTSTWAHGDDEVQTASHLGWRGFAVDENFTGFRESMEYGDGRRQLHTSLNGGVRGVWRHRISDGVRLLAGAELSRDSLAQTEQRISTRGFVWRDERALDATLHSAGAWLGTELKFGRVIATAGSRVDALQVTATDGLDAMRSGDGVTGAVSPRAAVAYRGEALSISLAAGRGVRPPEARAFTTRPSRENTDAMVYDGGDPAITMANAVELGTEWRGIEHLAFGATGFATWIDRESVFDHISGVNALRDGSRRVGAEAFVEAKPLPWLAVRGDVTAVDARFVVTGNPVPGAPRLIGSAEARVVHGTFSTGIVGRYLGARPLLHGATAAAYTVVDAVGRYTRGRYALSLNLDNVLASDWNEGEYHFASRWNTSAPASDLPRVHVAPGRPFGARVGLSIAF